MRGDVVCVSSNGWVTWVFTWCYGQFGRNLFLKDKQVTVYPVVQSYLLQPQNVPEWLDVHRACGSTIISNADINHIIVDVGSQLSVNAHNWEMFHSEWQASAESLPLKVIWLLKYHQLVVSVAPGGEKTHKPSSGSDWGSIFQERDLK